MQFSRRFVTAGTIFLTATIQDRQARKKDRQDAAQISARFRKCTTCSSTWTSIALRLIRASLRRQCSPPQTPQSQFFVKLSNERENLAGEVGRAGGINRSIACTVPARLGDDRMERWERVRGKREGRGKVRRQWTVVTMASSFGDKRRQRAAT